MSTLISAKPQRSNNSDGMPGSTGGPGGRILSGPLALVFLTEFCALTGFYLLLSVTPRYAAAVGAGTAGAGLVTGALLLGVPALALLPGGSLATVAAVSVVRGLGFGLCTVVTGALTAVLLPPERRGEGLGLFGIVATAPGIVALPGGVWLADRT